MTKKKKLEDAVVLLTDLGRVKKSSHVFERRSYDKSKVKNQMVAGSSAQKTFRGNSSDPAIVNTRKVSTFDGLEAELTATGKFSRTQLIPSVPVQNGFDVLEASIDECDELDSAAHESEQKQTNKSERCPPITVMGKSVMEISELIDRLQGNGKFSLRVIRGGGVQIRVTCGELFRKIEGELKKIEAEFFSHATRDEALAKVVLSGLPLFESEVLLEELAKNNIIPKEVKLLSCSKDKNSALYLLYFAKGSVKISKLRETKYLFRVVVWWRYYIRKKTDFIQCYRCQRWGHGSRHCNMAQRCVKCGGPHSSSACLIPSRSEQDGSPRNDPDSDRLLKCANCQQNHTASSKDCPSRKEFLKRQDMKAAQRTEESLRSRRNRTFTSSFITPGVSFSQATDRTPSGPSNSPGTAHSASPQSSPEGLFSMSEFLALARDMYSRLSQCTSKEDQFFALHELIVKYIYLH